MTTHKRAQNAAHLFPPSKSKPNSSRSSYSRTPPPRNDHTPPSKPSRRDDDYDERYRDDRHDPRYDSRNYNHHEQDYYEEQNHNKQQSRKRKRSQSYDPDQDESQQGDDPPSPPRNQGHKAREYDDPEGENSDEDDQKQDTDDEDQQQDTDDEDRQQDTDDEEQKDSEQEDSEQEDTEQMQSRIKSVGRGSRKGKRKQKKPAKRARLQTSEMEATDKRIYNASRMGARLAHPFVTFQTVVEAKVDFLNGEVLPPRDLRYLKVYDALVKIVPELDKAVKAKKRNRVDEIVQIMQTSANQAKHNDTRAFRSTIHLLIPLDDSTTPPAFKASTKADRGFGHEKTRQLLVAQKDYHKLDNAAFVEDILKKKYGPTFEDYPALMYDQSEADPTGKDPEPGLLKGYLPIRVARVILHGERNAFEPATSGKRSNAVRKKVKAINGRLIAYACVQAYFACTTAETWVEKVGTFDIRQWYEDIVDMFDEHGDDEVTEEILDHWNKEIFKESPFHDLSNEKPANPESASAKLKAARRARKAQNAQPS
uniref:Uncharacterized protein n=1 Tax=Mycena chlorophos TaxID=658473 RepID=A0ABQ0KUX2_MYCCL|nr:predicted protein [Mycena chlorophos]